MNITIVHEWTKERKTFDVTYYDAKIVTFMWPLSGTYEVVLKTNTIKARSPQARRKSPFCLWRVANIEGLRREVWELLNPDHKEREASYQRHQEWIASQGIKKCPTSTKSKSSRRRTRL